MTSLATGRMTESVKVWLVSWEASPGRFPPLPHISPAYDSRVSLPQLVICAPHVATEHLRHDLSRTALAVQWVRICFCQFRSCSLNPWSGKIPHAMEPPSLHTTVTEVACCNSRSPHLELWPNAPCFAEQNCSIWNIILGQAVLVRIPVMVNTSLPIKWTMGKCVWPKPSQAKCHIPWEQLLFQRWAHD